MHLARRCICFSRRVRIGKSVCCSHGVQRSISCCPVKTQRKNNFNELVKPVDIKPFYDPDGMSVGEELSSKLTKNPQMRKLVMENGLDERMYAQGQVSFRRYCIDSDTLPVELHITFSDIFSGKGHVHDLYPFFMQHLKVMFPHLECMEDLQHISDLRSPTNWYPEARAMQRKIIYHAGPTNSGKTYQALERFLTSTSGVYCGPLRLLANEVFHKANNLGTPCDLITGELRHYVDEDGEPSKHVACTVEMSSLQTIYDVGVIDEIQMLRDPQRGWAWSRALLGLCVHELHVCGEEASVDMVRRLADDMGDEMEVRRYKRLTPLTVLDTPLGRLEDVRKGDCIVCFGKQQIYNCVRKLEKLGHEVAVIYGSLPPGAKLAQAEKFNDVNNSCNILVATDAIGMGLNLNIKRVVFNTLMKPTIRETGNKEVDLIQPSQALQIAGRAGRFGTSYESGEATTLKAGEIRMLKKLLNTKIEPVKAAGLHPTAEQIELFAYHLPNATLTNLIDVFIALCKMDDSMYFMCNMTDFKNTANIIEHVPLELRARYVFCCAPIPTQEPLTTAMLLKFARQFSRGEAITFDWLCTKVGYPFDMPLTVKQLRHLECCFDVLDLYLWLSYRFTDMFPDTDQVRVMQSKLDEQIQAGVFHISRLLRNSETPLRPNSVDDEYVIKKRTAGYRTPLTDDDEANDLDVDGQTLMEDFQRDMRRKSAMPTMAEKLLRRGLITKEQLKSLQKEIADELHDK